MSAPRRGRWFVPLLIGGVLGLAAACGFVWWLG